MNAVAFMVQLPFDVHRRTKIIAKRLRSSMSQLTRDALTEKVKQIENEFRVEAALANADKQSKKRGLGTLGGIGDSPLAPSAPKTLEEQRESAATTIEENRLEIIYRHHATLVLAALADPTEKRLRIAEALSAVRNETPITEPPESEILATLEKHVLALRAQRKPEPMGVLGQSGFTAAMNAAVTAATPTPPPLVPSFVPSRFASPMTGKTVPEAKKKK